MTFSLKDPEIRAMSRALPVRVEHGLLEAVVLSHPAIHHHHSEPKLKGTHVRGEGEPRNRVNLLR